MNGWTSIADLRLFSDDIVRIVSRHLLNPVNRPCLRITPRFYKWTIKLLSSAYGIQLVKFSFFTDTWLIAGQEDFDRLRSLSYADTHVVMLCFSVDSPVSLENIETKVRLFQEDGSCSGFTKSTNTVRESRSS